MWNLVCHVMEWHGLRFENTVLKILPIKIDEITWDWWKVVKEGPHDSTPHHALFVLLNGGWESRSLWTAWERRKSIQSFGWKSLKGETAWKTWVKKGEYYKIDLQEIRWCGLNSSGWRYRQVTVRYEHGNGLSFFFLDRPTVQRGPVPPQWTFTS